MFLPASDIPSFVGKGSVDIGITGHDVILEAQMENLVTEVLKLGFGKCALQVQVPTSSPYQTVEQLAGQRIVTSFEVLAGAYFGQIDDKMGLKEDKRTKIEYVGGSVEAACALGLADGIGAFYYSRRRGWKLTSFTVDLVESGDTMRAAGLHPISTVLQSEAVLIASSHAKHPELVELVKNRIAGVVASGKYVLCQYNVLREKLPIVEVSAYFVLGRA